MKALSIKQPWATYIINGDKSIETRTWSTNYRGDILICSSAKPNNLGPEFPSGIIMGIAELYHISDMTKEDEDLALCDIYKNAKSWHLRNIRPFKEYIPIRGKLGLFDVDINIRKYI